jgi:hypothetical protein
MFKVFCVVSGAVISSHRVESRAIDAAKAGTRSICAPGQRIVLKTIVANDLTEDRRLAFGDFVAV